MLIEAPMKDGDTVTMKISNGDEIIARLVETRTNTYVVSKPLAIMATAQGLGLGPYAFTVTVLRITDNSEVPNARVTITDGNDLWFAYTDSDGEAELMIKSGIFTLTVWVAGSVHTSQTINVVGNSSTTTFVTPVVILPPAVNDMTSAYTYVNFAPNEGPVIFEFNLVIPPPEPTNFSYSLACFTITVQNGNSVLTVPLFKSARYRARRNNGTWVFFDTTTNSTFPLPPLPG